MPKPRSAILDREIAAAVDPATETVLVKLGKTIYRVLGENRNGLTLEGPRGGVCHLVPTTNRPDVYALNKIGKLAAAYYRRGADGAFTKM